VRSPAARAVLLLVALAAVAVPALVLRADPRPYVITAIDYHFHDAHPTFPIAPGRDLVVKNVGRNRHNVTIPALGFERNVAPDGQITIEDIGSRLGPGRYELICRIHLDRGMTGVIVISAD
jgi:plastocyanin